MSTRIPDFVDFMATQCAIDPATMRKLSIDPAFTDVLAAWRVARGAGSSLGYMAWYYMRHRGPSDVQLSDEQAVDYVRLGLYCSNLPIDDPRHVELDMARAKSTFPELFPNERPSAEYNAQVLGQLGTCAALHPLRLANFLQAKTADELSYVEFWIDRARDQIELHLGNERFVAGLDAASRGMLSFHGFLEKVYGPEYCDRVLQPKAYALFDELDPLFTGRVLMTLAAHVNEGRLKIRRDLDKKYPDIYEFYQPEHYGARRPST